MTKQLLANDSVLLAWLVLGDLRCALGSQWGEDVLGSRSVILVLGSENLSVRLGQSFCLTWSISDSLSADVFIEAGRRSSQKSNQKTL